MSNPTEPAPSGGKELKKVETPHPDWKPGQKQPGPYAGMGFQALDPKVEKSLYPLCISGVVPRPIALTSTLSSAGVPNLSPFSYFNILAHNPPTIAIGICRKGGGVKKDTLVNIQETGEFVVNIMSDWYIESANHTCGEFPPEDNEMDIAGLTPMASTVVKPCRVAESAFHMECKVKQITELTGEDGTPTTEIVMGTVVMFHVSEGVAMQTPSGSPCVDVAKLFPIGRLGANDYARVTEAFDLPRPPRPGQ